MVDQALLDKLKMMTSHPESVAYDSFLILFNIFKQLSEENDKVKKTIEGLNLCIQFVVIEEEEEIYKYWGSIRDGKVDFGEGDGPEVTATLKASREIFGNLLIQEANAINAFKAGDLKIEGSFQDIKRYEGVLLLVAEIIFKLIK